MTSQNDLREPPTFEERLLPMLLEVLDERRVESSNRPAPSLPGLHVRLSRKRVIVGAVMGLLLIGTAAAAAHVAFQGEPKTPSVIEKALTALFPSDQCITAREGIRLVRATLDRLGYSDWAVAANRGDPNRPCMMAAAAPEEQEVILVPIPPLDVSIAIQQLDQQLWTECLTEGEAKALIGAVLTRVGVSNWRVEVNEGAHPRPEDEPRERHLARGCFVLVGSEVREGGSVIYYINDGRQS